MEMRGPQLQGEDSCDIVGIFDNDRHSVCVPKATAAEMVEYREILPVLREIIAERARTKAAVEAVEKLAGEWGCPVAHRVLSE